MKSKSVQNLAEAAADPALDQFGHPHHPHVDVHAQADGLAHVNINAEGGRHGGGRMDLHAPPQNIHHNPHPPGSPLLRLHHNHDPDAPGGQDEAP